MVLRSPLSSGVNLSQEALSQRQRRPRGPGPSPQCCLQQLLTASPTPCPPGLGWGLAGRQGPGVPEGETEGESALVGHRGQTGHCALIGAPLAKGPRPGTCRELGGGAWARCPRPRQEPQWTEAPAPGSQTPPPRTASGTFAL